jgi:hypothetical protein
MPTTLADVATWAEALPEVTAGERYGGLRAWYVGKGKKPKSFVWERPLTKADIKRFGDDYIPQGEIIGLAVADLDEKELVLETGLPGVFTMEHFNGYPAVLIELHKARKRDVKRLIEDAWEAVAPPGRTPTH